MSAVATRRLGLPRISAATAAVIGGILLVLVAGWFWLRDSSLVGIRHVRVTGVNGPHAVAIRGALRASALTMTTLNVDMSRLRGSVEPFRDVESLSVSTDFPHGIVIHVTEQVPIAEVAVGGRMLAVDAAGTLLRSPVHSDGQLPEVPGTVRAGAGRLTDPAATTALRVLSAAPWRLIPHIAKVVDSSSRGLVVSLRNGPDLLFGDASGLRAKWAAAIAVLADSATGGAAYIDVSDPARPAAGAQSQSAPATPAGGTATSAGGTATSAGATTTSAAQGAAAQATPSSAPG